MSSINENEATYTGPVDINDGEGGFEALTDGFVKFLGAPWPGEAAIVENDEGVGTVIYTDREKQAELFTSVAIMEAFQVP